MHKNLLHVVGVILEIPCAVYSMILQILEVRFSCKPGQNVKKTGKQRLVRPFAWQHQALLFHLLHQRSHWYWREWVNRTVWSKKKKVSVAIHVSFLSKAKVWVTLPLLRNRIMFGQKRSKALFASMLYLVKRRIETITPLRARDQIKARCRACRAVVLSALFFSRF